MKTFKNLLLTGSAVILASIGNAQIWSPSGGNLVTSPAGTTNVGIGSGAPQARIGFADMTGTYTNVNGLTWCNTSSTAAQDYGIYRTNNIVLGFPTGSWNGPDYQQLKINWLMGIVLNPGTSGGRSYVDVQGNGMRVTSGKLFVGDYDASSSVNKASISFAGGTTGDAIAPLIVSKKITGTSDYRRFLFIPHNMGGGHCWMANEGDFSIIAHNTAGPTGVVIAPANNGWAGLRIAGNGNVSIAADATVNPYNFALNLSAANLGTGSGIWVKTNNANYGLKIDAPGTSIGSYVGPTKAIVVTDGTNEKFRVNNAGSVYAKELYLIYGTFPDYVFHKDYKLKDLSEVESFIEINSHLPNMPSASEVEKNGIGTAELETKLLEKVEELTLYMIQQDKKIKALEAENKNILESIHSK